jgi:hypothetical protein
MQEGTRMPISGTIVLGSEAIPASSSPNPYKMYSVTNPTGVQLYGFLLTNTANIPVNYTIFQDSLNNVIASGTIAALAGISPSVPVVQILLQGNLVNGETILATASQGGVVQLEVDGLVNLADPNTQMLQMMILMLSELGLDIPNQGAVNVGGFSF